MDLKKYDKKRTGFELWESPNGIDNNDVAVTDGVVDVGVAAGVVGMIVVGAAIVRSDVLWWCFLSVLDNVVLSWLYFGIFVDSFTEWDFLFSAACVPGTDVATPAVTIVLSIIFSTFSNGPAVAILFGCCGCDFDDLCSLEDFFPSLSFVFGMKCDWISGIFIQPGGHIGNNLSVMYASVYCSMVCAGICLWSYSVCHLANNFGKSDLMERNHYSFIIVYSWKIVLLGEKCANELFIHFNLLFHGNFRRGFRNWCSGFSLPLCMARWSSTRFKSIR